MVFVACDIYFFCNSKQLLEAETKLIYVVQLKGFFFFDLSRVMFCY